MKRPLTLDTLAVDRQMALLASLPLSSAKAHITLARAADLTLMMSDFTYLAHYPQLTTLHFYYDAEETPLAPVVWGNNMHLSTVVDFGIHSNGHVLRDIHYFAGANLTSLTLRCDVRAASSVTFPILHSLTLSRTYEAPTVTFPSLQRLTLLAFSPTSTLPRMPSAIRTLTFRACTLTDQSPPLTHAGRVDTCVVTHCTGSIRALMHVLVPFQRTLRHLKIEDMGNMNGDFIVDTAFADLQSIAVRHCNVRTVRFAMSSESGAPVAFEHLTEIVLERGESPMRPGVHPATEDAARYLPALLPRVSQLEMPRHTHFWLGALGLPELELYRGPYTIPPGAILESRVMDLDVFLLSVSHVTPWHTLLMHRLRIHNPDVLLMSSADYPFDIAHRATPPYFRKASIADPDAFFAKDAHWCDFCLLSFDKDEHDAVRASDIENADFFDDPYGLIDRRSTGCVVNCVDRAGNVHTTHFSHHTCFACTIFNEAPAYRCPKKQPLD